MRAAAKRLVQLVAIIMVAPLGLAELFLRRVFHRDVCFKGQGEILCLVPGLTGSYFRNAYYWMTLERCPLDCFIGIGSVFTRSGAVVGHRVYIGAFSRAGLVTIGDDVLLADHVQILSGKHQHRFSDPSQRMQDQPRLATRVHIGTNSWVGAGSIVMADVGANCVLGAGSIVVNPIPDNMIAVGNPARVLRGTYEKSAAVSDKQDS